MQRGGGRRVEGVARGKRVERGGIGGEQKETDDGGATTAYLRKRSQTPEGRPPLLLARKVEFVFARVPRGGLICGKGGLAPTIRVDGWIGNWSPSSRS